MRKDNTYVFITNEKGSEDLRRICKDVDAVRGKRSNMIHLEEFPADIVIGPGILQQIEDEANK